MLPTPAQLIAWLAQFAGECDDHDCVALRVQTPAESKRTRPGSALRPSHEWIDGNKTRRRMVGTAGFLLPCKRVEAMLEADVLPILDGMQRWGYSVDGTAYVRLVLIAGHGAHGEDMAEPHAAAIRDAVMVAAHPNPNPPPNLDAHAKRP